MGGKSAIAIGLVTGLVAGGAVFGGVLLLAPVPTAPVATPVADLAATPATTASAPSGSGSSAAPSAVASPDASPSGTTEAQAFGIGEPAPPLTVPQLGGGEITLSALEGKPVWVNFMATWCLSCRDELPVMNAFAARYADTGLVILAIDVREDEAVVDAFVRELEVAFPVGLDADGSAQSDWRAFAMPVHFWIDREGIVRDGALGGIGPDTMATGLGAILPGVTVTP